ncbi:MAG: phage portal protein [Holosporales bacterium]|jgi:HK97 family phage portal protein|nr:phage portal protein [Holosporales bacterium]
MNTHFTFSSLKNNFERFFHGEKFQCNRLPIPVYHTAGRPVWSHKNYESLATVGYSQNVIVFRCISLIAKSLSNITWLIYEKTNGVEYEVDSHQILALLRSPNAQYSGAAFLESIYSQLLLSGNAYIEAVMDGSNVPKQLCVLRSDRVNVLVNDMDEKVGFEYKNGKNKQIFPISPYYGCCDILHIKTFHPLNDWYGMSPVEAASRAIDQHNAVGEHNLSILQNGGRPSGALLVKPQMNGVALTAEQREELRESMRSIYEGVDNAGRIAVLEGDCEWKEMGLSPKDLDFHKGKSVSAKEIAQAFGVPPILIGMTEDATFSNYKEARINFWEDTLLPMLNHLLSELNMWLVPYFGANLRLDFDKDNIPALAAKRDHTWDKMQEASFLTINEKRQALGYGPLDGGDRLESMART